jgi:tRNA-specific 2-thiouridylase
MGRTPNPCIECNIHIKFGLLSEKAKELSASHVATGHYARLDYDSKENRYCIREGKDLSKDQSYVLFGLNQEKLSSMMLPIGELEKTEVRRIAGELGLRVFDKPDSQEICFVKKDYGDFLNHYAPNRRPGVGSLVNAQGQVVGTHEGSHLYTVGQRKRIGLTNSTPYFVIKVDAEKNEVMIGSEGDIYSNSMTVQRVNWQLSPRIGRIQVKIRSRHEKAAAEIIQISDHEVSVRFQDAQKAVTPGQAAVFYLGDRVLGGGWIYSSQFSAA